jgi:hypothetical protein
VRFRVKKTRQNKRPESYNKDEVLMQGIGVRAFANLKF